MISDKKDAPDTFLPNAESTPLQTKAKKTSIQASPQTSSIQSSPSISSFPIESKIAVTAQIHREPTPPSPLPITYNKKRRTPQKQYGFDKIEVSKSVDLTPKKPAKNSLSLEPFSMISEFHEADQVQLQHNDDVTMFEPNVVGLTNVTQEKNIENDVGNEAPVEILSVDPIDLSNAVEQQTKKQALLAKNPSGSKKAKKMANVDSSGRPSSSTESKKADSTISNASEVVPDPFDFVDETPSKRRSSGRISAKKSKEKIKEMIRIEKQMGRILGKKASLPTKRKSISEQPKKTTTKGSLTPVAQGPVVKKPRRLLNVAEYNSIDDIPGEENCLDEEVRKERRNAFQRKKQFDELTTSSFDGAALVNPQAKMARVMHNMKRVSEAAVTASPLNEINTNVLGYYQQTTNRPTNKNVTYSYRKSTTTSTMMSPNTQTSTTAMGVWSNEIEVNYSIVCIFFLSEIILKIPNLLFLGNY